MANAIFDGVVRFGGAVLAFLARLVHLVVALFGLLMYILGILFIIALAVLAVTLSYIWVSYSDVIIENGELVLRCQITPVWEDTVRPIYEIFQRIYNPLICWWNAINWFFFGLWTEVLFPLLETCDFTTLLLNLVDLFLVLAEDFVANYVASGDFMSQPFNETRTCNAIQEAWGSWQDLACCTCQDLCDILKVQPAFQGPTPFFPVPFPNPIGLILSNQIGDPATCRTFFGVFNAVMVIFQEVLRVVIEVILGMTPARPNFFPATDYYCDSGENWAKSFENIYQDAFDEFVPITVTFNGLLRAIGSLQCATGKAAITGVDILIHIDEVVQYPSNQYWLTPLMSKMAEVLNLIGTVNIDGWFMNPNSPSYPIFGRTRIIDDVCFTINYFLCDSTPPSICTDNGVNPDIFGPFTFDFICCAVDAAVSFVLDILAGLIEFTYHFTSTEDFFVFVDQGAYAIIDVLKAEVVRAVDCVASLLGIVPLIGFCLQDLLTLTAELALCLVSFLFKVTVGLITLPFFLAVLMPPQENYLWNPTRAIDDWNAILDLIAWDPDVLPQNARTIANCLCVVINYGVQFPPLPCTGQCNPVGFILPENMTRRGVPLDEFAQETGYSEDNRRVKRAMYGGGWTRTGFDYLTGNKKQKATVSDFDTLKAFFKRNGHKKGGALASPGLDPVLTDIDGFMENAYGRLNRVLDGEVIHAKRWRTPGWHHNLSDVAIDEFQGDGAREKSMSINYWAKHAVDVTLPPGVEKVERVSGSVAIDCTGTPDCFDLCCIIRESLDLVVVVLRVLANFIQGFARGYLDGFAYFKDRIFEDDLFDIIDAAIAPVTCVCDFLELVFPIPNLDVCAPILVSAELIKGILTTFLNSVFSFALGMAPEEQGPCVNDNQCNVGFECCTAFDDTGCLTPGPGTCVSPAFPYFTLGGFLADINMLIDITIELVEALCCILRAVLPIPGVDVCCFAERAAVLVLELIRWLLEIIISLSTIFGAGEGYFQGSNLNTVGFVVQADVVLQAIFGAPGGTCNQGDGGLLLCICGFLNLIIPDRDCPGLPAGSTECPGSFNNNCPNSIDPCCIIRELSFFGREVLQFAFRLLASSFQPTTPQSLIDFFFCDENAMPGSPLYSPSCGKLEPAIESIINLLTECPCQLFSLLDEVMGNSNCFCGTFIGDARQGGLLVEIPKLAQIILNKVLQLVRNFITPEYWTDPVCAVTISNCTWAIFFFGPIADQACIALASIPCLITVVFPSLTNCTPYLNTWFGGIIRWAFEVVIRVIELIIGFVETLQGGGDCFSSIPPNGVGTVTQGIDSGCLTSVLGNLLTLPFDVVLGDPLLDVSSCQCNGFSGDPRDFQGICEGCESSRTCACDMLRLPFCGGEGNRMRVQGILIGFIRYLTCLAFNLLGSPGLARAINGLAIFMSIIWQLSVRVIGIVISFINFFLALFSRGSQNNCDCYGPDDSAYGLGFVQGTGFGIGLCYPRCTDALVMGSGVPCRPRCQGGADCTQPQQPKALCSFLGAIQAFFDILQGIFTLFIPPPQNPAFPFKKRDASQRYRPSSRKSFSERVERYRNIRSSSGANLTDGVSLFFTALLDFDVTDCLVDEQDDHGASFINCLCRNFGPDVPGDLCVYDDELDVAVAASDSVTTADLTTAMAEMFSGGSACADLVRRCDHVYWKDIEYAERFEYVDCLAKHVQGHRIHELVPAFPEDFFHRPDALVALRDNLIEQAQQHRAAEREEYVRRRTEQQSKRHDPRLGNPDYEEARRKLLEKTLQESGMRDPFIIRQTIRLDRLERHLRSQDFADARADAWNNVLTGNLQLSVWGASKQVVGSFWETGKFIINQPYRQYMADMHSGVQEIARDLDRVSSYVYKRGVSGITRDVKSWETPYHRIMRRYEELRGTGSNVERVINVYYNGPFYKWWTSSWASMENPFRPFYDHVLRVIQVRRESRDMDVSARGVYWRVMDNIHETWRLLKEQFQVKWTPKKLDNWERAKRPFYYVWSKIAPHHMTREIQERFLFACNCDIFQGAVDLITELLDYCINEFVFNLPSRSHGRRAAMEYLQKASKHGNQTHFQRHRQRGSTVYWEQWMDDPISYHRPAFEVYKPRTAPKFRYQGVTAHSFKRSMTVSPAFDLFGWILCLIQDLFGGDLAQKVADFFMDFQNWVSNTNTDPNDCPDVGLLYWVLFPFRCNFPENLNCMNPCALGLKKALPNILLIALIGVVAAIFISPLQPFIAFFLLALFLVGLPGAAWHWSPRCVVLTPAFPIGGGFSIPVWPLPVSLAFPECFFDDLKDVVDSVLNDCPLEPLASCNTTEGSGQVCLLPACMYNGPVCPPCPEKIDVANCITVGMAFGFENIIYAIYRLWPGFCDWVMANLTGSGWSAIIPVQVVDYIEDQLALFKAASDAQICRYNWCFWASILSVALPIVVFVLLGAILAFLLPPLIGLFISFIYLFIAAPVPRAFLPGGTDEYLPLEDDEEEEEEQNDRLDRLERDVVRQQRRRQESVVSEVSQPVGQAVRSVYRALFKQKRE